MILLESIDDREYTLFAVIVAIVVFYIIRNRESGGLRKLHYVIHF